MNKLNCWQRIAVVISAILFCAVAYYLGHDFPTETRIYSKIALERTKARADNGHVRDEALRECDIQSSGDLLKKFTSGCRRSAHEKYGTDNQWAERIYDSILQKILGKVCKIPFPGRLQSDCGFRFLHATANAF